MQQMLREVNQMKKLSIMAIIIALMGLVNGLRRRPKTVQFANISGGTHDGSYTKKTDAAVSTRYLLGKVGSDVDHIAACGASEIPVGVITDEASAAEELVAVELLGVTKRTLRMVASEAIDAGEHVYTAASGKVQDLPAGAGTYYEVGLALTSASADGDLIEVATCVARKTVVSG